MWRLPGENQSGLSYPETEHCNYDYIYNTSDIQAKINKTGVQ